MISGEMTVARLIEEHPELLEVLADCHAHFKQFRNRLLRRVMAPRLTVGQAARMAGVPEAELLARLRRAAGEANSEGASTAPSDTSPRTGCAGEAGARTRGANGCDWFTRPEAEAATPSPGTAAAAWAPGARPAALAELPPERQVHVDVRDDIGRGEEPFAKIMAAVKGLRPDQALVLRVPFEPVPLYDVLGKRGFAHWTERHDPSDWSVWFYRAGAGPAPPVPARAPGAGVGRITIDVRGLEPPQPMVRVLEALDTLAPGQRLEVIHDRRPLFLYPQLEAQGFAHETEEPEPGLVRILIRRGS